MIRIAICGYGNLGKGVEKAIKNDADMELKCVISRRHLNLNLPVFNLNDFDKIKYSLRNMIDVVIMCGGSKNDLIKQVPLFATAFNTVDSFDTHKIIYNYYKTVDRTNKKYNTTSIISAGWDPGLFSIQRLYANSILPNSKIYTFWGKGISQGHTNAIKEIKGVKNAVQYTIPKLDAIKNARSDIEISELSEKDKHIRECYVVAEKDANKDMIKNEIINIKNYFEGYDTRVYFISEEELKSKHNKMKHGGIVICNGKTGNNKHKIEYSLKLDSNPDFTGSVLVSYARAAYNMAKSKDFGAKTVFDIPPKYLTYKTNEELITHLL